SAARRALASGGAILPLFDNGTLIGAILIEPALLSGAVLLSPLVLRGLSGGLVATAILLRPFAILLRLAALIAVAILELPLACGFATAAILLRLAAPIAVAILKLPLARGFATATILLRCTALVPRGWVIPRATLILLQTAGRRVTLLLLRISGSCSRDHADGCDGNEKSVPVHWKPHRESSLTIGRPNQSVTSEANADLSSKFLLGPKPSWRGTRRSRITKVISCD
ncbi:MAG TPA: hypothetical protein VGQ40_07625, partial [Chthoniobacterales bacterium]|nr:hypothetical protein [Chthoniobacterales bacterium]